MGKRIDSQAVYRATGGESGSGGAGKSSVRVHQIESKPRIQYVQQVYWNAQRRMKDRWRASPQCRTYYHAYHKEMKKDNPNMHHVRFLERATKRFCGGARSHYH